MPKKYLGLIGLFILAIGLLVSLNLAGKKQDIRKKASGSGSVLTVEPTTLSVNTGDTFQVLVNVDTGDDTISASKLYLAYDPAVLTGVSITPGTFLPTEIVKGYIGQGMALITVGSEIVLITPPDTYEARPKKGVGTLATLKFTALQATTTKIEFNAATEVVAIGKNENTLAQSSGSTITVNDVASIPTATPIPGVSSTPVPPTDTPIPPTLTLVPPTSTPVPTITPTPTPSQPTINSVTISNSTIIPDNTTQYTISATASDPTGASEIYDISAMINNQGKNSGTYRGHPVWQIDDNYPSSSYPEKKACSGVGGWAVIKPGVWSQKGGTGPYYIHLDSCTVADSGNSRTVNFVVRFDPAYTYPLQNNDISGLTFRSGQSDSDYDWTYFQTDFNIELPPTLTPIPTDTPIPTGSYAIADLNRDGQITFDDLIVFLQNYGNPDCKIPGDLDSTCGVNFDDLVIFLQNYQTK